MKKFFKRHEKTIIKAALITAAAIIAYELAHDFGTAERGYNAIGGEIFVPFLIVFAKDILEMIKAPFKAISTK